MHKFILYFVKMLRRTADCLESHFNDKKHLDVEPSLDSDSTSNEKVEVVTRDENYGKATPIRYELGGPDMDHPNIEYILTDHQPIKSTTYPRKIRVIPDGDEYIAA